jgi:phosphatidylglycerophosphatase A
MTTSDKSSAVNPAFNDLIKHPVLLLAFGFGSGLAPKAPGTFGTVIGVLFYLLLQPLQLPIFIAVTIAVCLVGIPICGVAATRLGVHDHSGIVWDEIAGYLVTMAFVPHGWLWVIAGFIAFRIFDILKPWPICVLDRKLKGGFGIMLDDVVAGIFAGATLWLLNLNL